VGKHSGQSLPTSTAILAGLHEEYRLEKEAA
jgi:hypothetical protein